MTTDTVNGEMYPRAVDTDVVTAIQKQHRTLVPAVVRHPDIRQFDRRLTNGSNAAVKRRVHAWRVAVEEDEHGSFDAHLPPGDDVLNVNAAWIAHLALEDSAGAERRRLAEGARRSRTFGRRHSVVTLFRDRDIRLRRFGTLLSR